ncbi:transcription factor Tfb2-domain-containing protein [Flagelloscypha sp. PMI_526]|nr:transcription factor Tfb2-domain-containing protein [Flagelloscypha sp. PMI_526]
MPSATEQETEIQGTSHALLPFLKSQSQNTLTRLYKLPSSCLSVLRLLTPLERQLVMSLLWLEAAVPITTMAGWVFKANKKLFDLAIQNLSELHIVPSSSIKYQLNPTFKTGLREALTAGGESSSFGVPTEPEPDKLALDVHGLDSYALERWETILHYMVSSGRGYQPKPPAEGVKHLLQASGLMDNPRGEGLQISSRGFQFLLHTPHAQLWELLIQYLCQAEERKMDLVEILSFLFMLSTAELGKEYSAKNLTETQKALLHDLRDYGLLWQRKPSSRRFSPTRLATTLTSSSPPLPSTTSGGAGGASEGFIILETNYRVYAYTDNPLQTAVLNLFIHLKYRFPNLVVGSITRDSVKKALSNGISADQIITYLTAHAHPQMHRQNPLLPVTVQDQIRLWEVERTRVQSENGFLYTAFASQADYDLVLNYAKELGVVLWDNAMKRSFFGTLEGHALVKQFIERRSQGGG